jgi:hypothetical protein
LHHSHLQKIRKRQVDRRNGGEHCPVEIESPAKLE